MRFSGQQCCWYHKKYLVPHSTTLHLLVIHMYIFRCGAHHLRLPHSQTMALVSDNCFSFPITQIPTNYSFTTFSRSVSFHSISSYLNFWVPSAPPSIMFSRVTHSTNFSPLLDNGGGSTFVGWTIKKKTLCNSDTLNLIMFSVGTKHPHKA